MSRLHFDAVLLAAFAIMVVASWGLSAHARVVPLAVALPGLLLMAEQTARDWRRRRGEAGSVPQELRAIVWVLMAPSLMLLCGLAAGALVYLLLYLRWQAALSWPVATGTAALTGISLTVLFDQVLNLPLYRGLLWERLFL